MRDISTSPWSREVPGRTRCHSQHFSICAPLFRFLARNQNGASVLHLIFKKYNFNNMNVLDLIPAAGQAAELMRSLSHPQRLMVLCALGSEEKSVAELRRELGGIEQVPLSQQLMRLRADGLVESRRDGRRIFYRIARPEVIGVIEALQSAFCRPAESGKLSSGAASRRRTEGKAK